ncbi:hypothetical protein [Candidatus Methylacidiphilum infernorum]|nr:hypothetical protein [Candidatus Methylacidiphilum infernorum]
MPRKVILPLAVGYLGMFPIEIVPIWLQECISAGWDGEIKG